MKTARWPFVVGVLLGGYLLYREAPRTAGVPDRNSKYFADISADGSTGNSVKIVFYRPSGTSWTVTVVIPAGTIIHSLGTGGQRLITAAPVTVVVSNSTPAVTVIIPTYCIDQFAATPRNQEQLAFDPRDAQRRTEETDPLHKLIDCMRTSSASAAYKQLVVWTIAEDLLHKTPREALQFLTGGIEQQMLQDRRQQLQERRAEIISKAPLLSNEQIDASIEQEMQDGTPAFHRVAAAQAAKQLKSLKDNDRTLLTSCGYPLEQMPLFQQL